MFKKTIDQLLETEMDRKEFLKNVGIAAVVMTGATAALKAITPAVIQKKASPSSVQFGYGQSPYGGDQIKKIS